MNLDKLDNSEKFIFMWQYGMLGDFKTALIRVIMRADDSNLDKLSSGFPDEIRGYMLYSRKPGWWKEVQLKAGIESD